MAQRIILMNVCGYVSEILRITRTIFAIDRNFAGYTSFTVEINTSFQLESFGMNTNGKLKNVYKHIAREDI